jgi:hypothetical protein
MSRFDWDSVPMIVEAETPITGIDHLPSRDMAELWQMARAEIDNPSAVQLPERHSAFVLADLAVEEDAAEEELLSFSESLDTIEKGRVTAMGSLTLEGLTFKAASKVVKPIRKNVTRRAKETLAKEAAIVAESIRTGRQPKKKFKSELHAAALRDIKNANGDELLLNALYTSFLEKYGLTPAKSMELAEGAFRSNEKRGKKITAVAAMVATLLFANQLIDGDGAGNARAAMSESKLAPVQDTNNDAATTTIAPANTAPVSPQTVPAAATQQSAPVPSTTAAPAPVQPASSVAAEAPPVTDTPMTTTTAPQYSEYQARLGKRLEFTVQGQSVEYIAQKLRENTGEDWTAATYEAFTGKTSGYAGEVWVKDCPDGTFLIKSGDTLGGILEKYDLSEGLWEMYNKGKPQIKAGFCAENSDRAN